MRYFYGSDAQTVTFAKLDATAALGYSIAAFQPAVVKFYTAQTGGTQITDLLDASGNAISGGTITTDGNGVWPRFQGPDGALSLWADGGSGERVQVFTADIATLIASLTAAVAAAQNAQGLLIVRAGQNRPDTSQTGSLVQFVTPTQPTAGGTSSGGSTSAAAGDLWVQSVI